MTTRAILPDEPSEKAIHLWNMGESEIAEMADMILPPTGMPKHDYDTWPLLQPRSTRKC